VLAICHQAFRQYNINIIADITDSKTQEPSSELASATGAMALVQ
jgi:hypothetical protein